LSNAFKFTGDGGHIDVHVRTEKQPSPSVVIEVIDNGSGVAPEDLPHIFDPFRQGKKLNNAGGTGLGLAYSKSLVELHGGDITAQSETERIGENRTVFSVRIPLRTDPDAVQAQGMTMPMKPTTVFPADDVQFIEETTVETTRAAGN